jgi:hypothetical protein
MIKFDNYGETPLDDISRLKLKIVTRTQLDNAICSLCVNILFKHIADLFVYSTP